MRKLALVLLALGIPALAATAADLSLCLVGRRLAESAIALAGEELRPENIHWVNWNTLELRLVGLLDEKLLTLGLGLLLPSAWERRQIIIHTPLPSRLLDRVRFCRLGEIRLGLTGEELPHL